MFRVFAQDEISTLRRFPRLASRVIVYHGAGQAHIWEDVRVLLDADMHQAHILAGDEDEVLATVPAALAVILWRSEA